MKKKTTAGSRTKAARAAQYDGPFELFDLEFNHFSLQTPDYLETFGVAGMIWPDHADPPKNAKEMLDWCMILAWTLWADQNLVDEVALQIEDAYDEKTEKAAWLRLKREVKVLRLQIPIEGLPQLVDKFRVLSERIRTLDFDTVARETTGPASDGDDVPGNS